MIKNEIFKIIILLIIGCTFLYLLPLFITFIEESLKRNDNKSKHKFVDILLYIISISLSSIYILLIYYSNFRNTTFRVLILSTSMLFAMIRFAKEDYRQIGKTILFNIFNAICVIFIFFELFIALITK